MSISILNNRNSLHTANTLKTNGARINHTMNQIATGQKNPYAANNPSAYSIYVGMTAQVLSLNQSSQNTQTGNAMLKTAAGAAHSTVESLSALKEKLISAANGTNNASDRGILQEEVNQLVASLDDNAGVSFNGQTLTDGSFSGGNAMQIAGGESMTNVTIGDLTSENLSLTADGKPTIDLSTQEGISKAMDLLDGYTDDSGAYHQGALEQAISTEAHIGAQQKALEYKANNLTTAAENTTAAASTIGDANIAKASASLSADMTLQQAKILMLAQANRSNTGVLALLR